MVSGPAASDQERSGRQRAGGTWGSASGQQQVAGSNFHEERVRAGSPSAGGHERSYSPSAAGIGTHRQPSPDISFISEPQLQQVPTAAAFVSVGGSADGGPRSPSRLRYSYSSIASPRQRTAAGGLPEFIHVEEAPPDAGLEDVQIQHVRADEHMQQADVQDKIINQVDELVEYFNALYHDDQVDITQLQQQLSEKNLELSIQNEVIQRLRHRERPQPVVYSDAGVWAAIKQAWRPKHTCWSLLFLLFLIALMLAIVLPTKLIRDPAPTPASFSTAPQLVAATSSSVDLLVGVSEPTVIHYVMIPRASGRRLQAAGSWEQYSAAEVAEASAGWGTTALEGVVSACGSLYVASSDNSLPFSISSQASNECAMQRALYASGGKKPSCQRCPLLQPALVYDVLLVVGMGGLLSDKIHLEVSTAAAASSAAPNITPSAITGTVPTANRTTATVQASVAATSENAFKLTFSLDAPGTVKYLVVYGNMYGRFGDRYVVFSNGVEDASSKLYVSRASFQDGVVARGEMRVSAASTDYTCTIGGNSSGNCSCSYGDPCTQEIGCFGGLCDYSPMAIMPNSTYKVVLIPVSQDGTSLGSPITLGPFTTPPAKAPPTPSSAMAVAATIGPDRFTIQNIQQDKPGYVHVVVTQPFNQVYKLTAGTATAFTRVPDSPTTRRHLLATTNDAIRLPAESGADKVGALFFPPCKEPLACNASDTVTAVVNPLVEKIVFQKCVPLNTITEKTSMIASPLVNAMLYRAITIHSDTSSNKAVWSAMVRTQDLTPPVLTVVDTPPPDFDSFSILVKLDEAGTIYGGLLLAVNQPQVSATVTCEPAFTGPMVTIMNPVPVPEANKPVTLTFDSGLTANTDYVLKLIAKDEFGNCQAQFTDLLVHTLDNVPPITLAMDVVSVTGDAAALQLTLNEPGTVYYIVLSSRSGAPTCPAPDQLFSLTVPNGVSLPSPSCIGNFTIAAANTPAQQSITGLTSETPYRACAVARDNTRLQNRQTESSLKDLTTLDVTAPQLTVRPLAGSDGNFTCSRTTYLCNLVFNSKLNEPGDIIWALVPQDTLPATWPTPQQVFASSSNVSAVLPGAVASGTLGAADTNTTAANVNSDTVYVLVVAARDAAKAADGSLKPNYIASLAQLPLIAPDVTPPVFTDVTLSAISDTQLTVDVTLNEDSVAYYVVVQHPSSFPTPTQVSAGKAFNNTVPVTAGMANAAATTATTLQAAGLLPGELYDVYLVAKDDPAGNLQLKVTNITNVRTTDSRPPMITSLAATFTPPMTFTITANITKQGWVIYAPRKAADPAPTAADVLSAFHSGDPALANFTASLDIPTAGVSVTGNECVADGDQLVVYAVAQDGEGRWPGRQNNTSPLARAAVQLVPANFGSSCIPPVFLAPLQPSLSVARTSLLPGLMLGLRNSSSSPTGASWQQDALGLMAANLQLTARAGAVKLPGGINLPIQPNPPAAVAVFAQTPILLPDANGAEGSTLRISYQLSDAAGRTQVDTTNVTVRPMLSYGTGVSPPTGTTAADNALPGCDLTAMGGNSGVGQCSVQVAKRFFPATGTFAARVVLKVLIGTTQVATSASSNITLQASPSTPAFTPSTPGLLITLPYRPVYRGETIKVTLEAVNGLAQGLTGFTVPLKYNMQQLAFVSAQLSGLWLMPTQAAAPAAAGGNYSVIALQTYGRAGNNPDSAYRSSSSIPLVDVYFRVITAVPGTAANIISIDSAPSRFSFDPSWTNPYYQINSFNGQGTSGSLNIGAVSSLGMWAWADTYDVFNSAALTGQKVSVSLRGVLVKTSGTMDVEQGDSVTGCVITSGAGAASAMVDQSVCKVSVDAMNTVAAKGMTVVVSLPVGNQADVSAEVKLNVWYPANLALTASDTTLNKILPINAAQPSASCLDMYQSTTLSLTADWKNGGAATGDTWLAADVTDLATYKSSDTNVAMIQTGGVVKGIRAGTAAITVNSAATPSAISSPSLTITVSDNAVCLKQLSALATTGAGLTATSAAALAATPARTAARTALSWQAQQQLVWEDSSALVLSYASFSDGTYMDVSARAAVSAAVPAGVTPAVLPFNLDKESSTQLPLVKVNATVGAGNTCQQYLSTSWSVCSLPLGSGTGTVRLQLPEPAAVASFIATPINITGAANTASVPPVSLPSSSRLSLMLSFSDGTVRDFSSDARSVYTVTAGAGLCNVVKVAGGWYEVTASGNLPGLCEITATVTFPGKTPLSASTRVQVVTLTKLEVAALGVNVIALPEPLATSQLLPDDNLLLLKCDARNYDTRTLWTLGVLSNCTSNNTCPMVGSINDARYLTLTSSDKTIADIMTGFPGQSNYPTYGLLGNRLVPFKAGTTTAAIALGSGISGVTALTRNIAVTVKDTYQPTWPTAAAASDTTVSVAADMSDVFTVTYQMVEGSKLDLVGDPPSPTDVETAGVSLVATPAQGPNYLSATAANLKSGMNYTLLTTVRQGSVLSPGVTALTGVLVPDTTPPSFTKSVVKTPATPNVVTGDWSVQVDVGLNEQGKVYFAVYGDPSCVTGDPDYNEVKQGANLADQGVNKCSCSDSYCQAAAKGEIDFAGSTTSDVVTINAAKPPFPFDDLPNVATCIQYTASKYASKVHAVYFIAEDDLPTYKGWTSVCNMPVVPQNTPPTPCAPVTIGQCTNTPPAVETVNRQAVPYAAVDMYTATSAAAAPPRSPLKGTITVVDPVPAGFQQASINSTGTSLIFTFQTSKIGLVMWKLVEQVTVEIANGYVAVRDSSVVHTVKMDRKCSGVPLVPGTAYALWYNMTDIYGSTTDINILRVNL